MNPITLTRAEAMDAIDAADTGAGALQQLLDLQEHWIGHRDHSHNDDPRSLAQLLAEYVDACAAPANDRTPRSTDPTGLTALPVDSEA